MTERRAALLRVLCLRRHDTISNLAAEFGVSERTIRRDIEDLSCTEPIYTQSGRYGGGVYVSENYSVDRLYLRDIETALLVRILREAQAGRAYVLTEEDTRILKRLLSDHAKPPSKGG